MNIVVINGTEVRGCTYQIKESFLKPLRAANSVTEFYLPGDGPSFCCGCKTCFFKSEQLCPHAEKVMPIWNAILSADLLVFAYPVYVLRAPGQLKTLLDHFGCHWMVHRPDRRMFTKRAVILTQSIGAPNGAAQKDVATSLLWLGVSCVRRLGFGLMEGVVWNELFEKRRNAITQKTEKLAARYVDIKPARQGLRVKALFAVCKLLHKKTVRHECPPSADNQHWIDNGWLKR